jgi:Gamma tubulin complex component C-terminal
VLIPSRQDYVLISELMPSFVTPPTAATVLFIGKSLNHARVKSSIEAGPQGLHHLSSQLKELSSLSFPLSSAAFSRTMTSIRQTLSRNTLRKLLPLSRIVEILRLLREFFLLGRGEFAMALTHEADEKIRSRWRRADSLAYEKRGVLNTVVVKEGEVAAVLGRTWAAMGSMQGQHADEDEGLELARDLLRLNLTKSKPSTPFKLGAATSSASDILVSTPFRNLLFSVPVTLTVQIPPPLDMFLTPNDLQIYTVINSYLLSIRRAHIRLTDLWKITALRRHHPAPPGPPIGSSKGGRSRVVVLRERHAARSSAMRSAWVTSSAAIFFLAETEAYLQTEVVAGLWDGFHEWLTAGEAPQQDVQSTVPSPRTVGNAADAEDEDIWLSDMSAKRPAEGSSLIREEPNQPQYPHDPQTLSTAHNLFLTTLARRLLLTQATFSEPLYDLLVHVDHLVALIHRLHGIWTSMDLEADAGVVDAFVDLENEESDVKGQLRSIEGKVKGGVETVIAALRELEMDSVFMAQIEEGGAGEEEEIVLREEGDYTPRRVGGIDRLLMKLDFGVWFGK